MTRTCLLAALCLGILTGAEEGANTTAPESTAKPPTWVNLSAGFLKELGTHQVKTVYLRRGIGMWVTPAGDVFVQTSTSGVCVSRDQGATWSVVAGNKVTGSCHTDSVSMAYPYDGRMAIFCMDGTGGMSLDDGKTWRPFGRIHRNHEYADVDWSDPAAQTILGMTHEPYFTVLSTDAGKTWRRILPDEDGKTPLYRLGVVDAKTLLRAHVRRGGIEASTDAGQTWARVAEHHVSGVRPVHYGKNLYWGSTKGVITSSNGTDWTLLGQETGRIYSGPFFGTTEQELMVVTDKAFLATRDGGRSWQELAPKFRGPGIFAPQVHVQDYYGWDAERNILYCTGLSTDVHALRVGDTP